MYTLRVKNSIKITLSPIVSKIDAFLYSMQNLKMAVKYGVKVADDLYPGVKNFNEIDLSCTVSEINAFYAEIQDGHQNGGKMIFGKKW